MIVSRTPRSPNVWLQVLRCRSRNSSRSRSSTTARSSASSSSSLLLNGDHDDGDACLHHDGSSKARRRGRDGLKRRKERVLQSSRAVDPAIYGVSSSGLLLLLIAFSVGLVSGTCSTTGISNEVSDATNQTNRDLHAQDVQSYYAHRRLGSSNLNKCGTANCRPHGTPHASPGTVTQQQGAKKSGASTVASSGQKSPGKRGSQQRTTGAKRRNSAMQFFSARSAHSHNWKSNSGTSRQGQVTRLWKAWRSSRWAGSSSRGHKDKRSDSLRLEKGYRDSSLKGHVRGTAHSTATGEGQGSIRGKGHVTSRAAASEQSSSSTSGSTSGSDGSTAGGKAAGKESLGVAPE